MSRQGVRIVLLFILLGVSWYFGKPQNSAVSSPAPAAGVSASARQTWGRPETLPDHFARHGHDFGARTPDDYAAQARAFLERAKTSGLPAKRDRNGDLRVYDPATDTFGAYNADGTTKTFFKPGNPGYFDHQPGERVDLRATK
ncbi:Pyocin large subunit-like protein [Chthoniobacter flavus Ellin428]|uniref:Pyocin large subunit-like protein n=1 Tax=Chthoniobacter flavus Ellin428 TaxID=497964 RepID=B4D0B5_9BACT|nr:hypothetical protein [Chthoniobacter flavus]EDY20429.1 Pyocin large subunit-like protein [Chthoniobacter flavus Ellin428]TCO83198.1 hypothetical protein EV701_14312 [Chthoniobacter flavus]